MACSRAGGENAPASVSLLYLVNEPVLNMEYGRLGVSGVVNRGEQTLLMALKQNSVMDSLEPSASRFQLVYR